MSRIEVKNEVEYESEAVAPIINIHWNPETDDGHISFNCQILHKINGKVVSRDNKGTIVKTIADIVGREVTITLPDESTFVVPPLLIGAYIKQVFSDVYAESLANDEILED